MPETPNLSPDELYATRYLVNGDTGAAQREVVRRLQQNLPGLVAKDNTVRGWSGSAAIPVPAEADILSAPAEITAAHIGKILVAAHVGTINSGSGVFKNNIAIVIQWLDQRIVAEQQVWTLWARGELIRTTLRQFLNGCVDDNEFLCWRQLIPDEMQIIGGAADRADYSAVQVGYLAVQTPNMNQP